MKVVSCDYFYLIWEGGLPKLVNSTQVCDCHTKTFLNCFICRTVSFMAVVVCRLPLVFRFNTLQFFSLLQYVFRYETCQRDTKDPCPKVRRQNIMCRRWKTWYMLRCFILPLINNCVISFQEGCSCVQRTLVRNMKLNVCRIIRFILYAADSSRLTTHYSTLCRLGILY